MQQLQLGDVLATCFGRDRPSPGQPAKICSQISRNYNYCILFDVRCVLAVLNTLYRWGSSSSSNEDSSNVRITSVRTVLKAGLGSLPVSSKINDFNKVTFSPPPLHAAAAATNIPVTSLYINHITWYVLNYQYIGQSVNVSKRSRPKWSGCRPLRETLSYCYMARLLLCPWDRTLSQYVAADADFIRDHEAVFRDMINGTPVPVSPKCIMSHHHLHNISFMELGHLLTRSGLTYPEVSSKVYHDSFCHLWSSISLPWVIYFKAFNLHVVSSFSCIPVIFQ